MKQESKINAVKANLSRARNALISRFALTLLLGLITSSAVLVFVSANIRKESSVREKPSSGNSQPRIAGAGKAAQEGDYVRRVRLWPQLQGFLNRSGDRLEKPGKERLVLAGSITRLINGRSETRPVRLISEYPDRLRLEEQIDGQVQVTIFDKGETFTSNKSAAASDQDVIETLVFDTVDRFFNGQMHGLGTRFLGGRFRLDDGQKADYSGPFLDVYQMSDQIRIGSIEREQPKFYCFNSDTQLLDRVQYQLERDKTIIEVIVQSGNWQKVQGQMLPGRIERLENGQPTFVLDVVSASFIPRMADGAFNRP